MSLIELGRRIGPPSALSPSVGTLNSSGNDESKSSWNCSDDRLEARVSDARCWLGRGGGEPGVVAFTSMENSSSLLFWSSTINTSRIVAFWCSSTAKGSLAK
eukprot:CAMPEP_0119493510 /NCGR_PEP_ID=MMETSP1344-20130328/17746_1 /TAXON_ID=236787 /ORGANISM="Florenciella parvula, Strain CCMP2471" /LENGTH=101 /DNA_ID=CAMNT_0007528943 /DNA_START=11 /DNA_END=316 /DNA_ORIENTATION=-